MGGQEVVKAAGLAQGLRGVEAGLRDGRIARGVEGHDLFDGDGCAGLHRAGELVGDDIRLAVELPLRVDQAGLVIEAGPGHFDHVQQGLRGPAAQQQGLGVGLAHLQGLEVPAGQGPVARHALIDHAAVQGGAHRQAPRPVLGGDLDGEPGQMRLGHADQALLLPPRDAALRVPEPHGAAQHPLPQVELLAVGHELDCIQAHPRPVVDAHGQREPVGEVHQVFVLDVPAGDGGRQAVIPASEIRARIVHGVRPTVRRRAAGRHIAIAQRTERFPEPLRAPADTRCSSAPTRAWRSREVAHLGCCSPMDVPSVGGILECAMVARPAT